MHGFVSAPMSRHTRFSESDCEILWEALRTMFDLDRASSRGEMSQRGLYVFKHALALGNAPAHKLLERVTVTRTSVHDRTAVPPARKFSDYFVTVNDSEMPDGVTLLDLT